MGAVHAPVSVAVIGAGPRGISIVERLSAHARLEGEGELSICLFDPYKPGGGRIWSGDQPQHLLMNTLCADATHFTDDSVRCDGPVVEGPTLYEWCQQVQRGEVDTDRSLRAEATAMQPWSHPSRKLLGQYLEWCFQKDLAELPAHVNLRFRQDLVIDLEAQDQGYLLRAHGDTVPEYFDSVILASGHSDLVPKPQGLEWAEFASKNGLFYGRSTNPTDQNLEGILPGQKVILRGLGMNFFDYVSLLTVGRGGEFKENGAGGLEYVPSGREPVIVAGSRRGVPYRAKGMFGTMTPSFPRRYLTEDYLDNLEAQGRQLDFMTDLWPAIAKDTVLTYYRILFAEKPTAFKEGLERVEVALDTFAWGSPELQSALIAVIPAVEDRIDIDRLDRPLHGLKFATYQDFLAHWREDLVQDYFEASKGYRSALKCASVALGSGRGAVRRLAPYGGFRGQSYRRDIEGWYRGFGGAVASGPPANRILELIALVDAGLFLPIGPDMRVDKRGHNFSASSPTLPDISHECQGLLEAHLPAVDLMHSANPLHRKLVQRGMARPFIIRDEQAEDFQTGAMEVGPSPFLVIDADGKAQPGLFAVGVPLESIHWGTQLGPLANTNSQFLRDNDAMASAALAYARSVRQSCADQTTGPVDHV